MPMTKQKQHKKDIEMPMTKQKTTQKDARMPMTKENIFKNYIESSPVQLEKAWEERVGNEIFLRLSFSFLGETENQPVTIFLKTGPFSSLKIQLNKSVEIKLKKELKNLNLTIKKIVTKGKTTRVKKSQVITPAEKDSLEFFYSHPHLKILPSEMMSLFERRKELFFPEIFEGKDYFQCFCGKILQRDSTCPICGSGFTKALAFLDAYAKMEEKRHLEKREKEKEIFDDTLQERDLLLKDLEENAKEKELIEREVMIFLMELKKENQSGEEEEILQGKRKWLENIKITKPKDFLAEIEGLEELLQMLESY